MKICKFYLGIIVLMTLLQNVSSQNIAEFLPVEAKKNSLETWKTYNARTIDRISGFTESKEPEFNQYGSWKVDKYNSTGFFRTEFFKNRWWIIDPEGYPYYCKGVAVFTPGRSYLQKENLKNKFENNLNWAVRETDMLKSYGFNGTGGWSSVADIRNMSTPLPYTIIIEPMSKYKYVHRKSYGGKYKIAGWQGYRYDLIMVFDPEFDQYIAESMSKLSIYKDDKFLLGYFTDNELPWKNDALDRHLKYLEKTEAGYIVTKKWLDERKGKDASLSDIDDNDRLAFTAFYFETYIRKVSKALRAADPNHLYLGCRFNTWTEELSNPEIFRVAGKYMDVISINHYHTWQPDQKIMDNWAKWSGRPFLITEWYVKGEDTGLPNKTGAGWQVHTQLDRGLFYQNFTIELLKSKSCVGWHWFKYQDNDPLDLGIDESNRDSNKGLVDSDYNAYKQLLNKSKEINNNVWNLIHFFDSFPNKTNKAIE